MTLDECIVLAMADACHYDLSVELSEVDITLVAWKMFRDRFGFGAGGSSDFPDRKKVSQLLSRTESSCLKTSGFIEKSRAGRWRLTQAGIDRAVVLLKIFREPHKASGRHAG